MKILFDSDALMALLSGSRDGEDVRYILNCCEDKKIKGYLPVFAYTQAALKMDNRILKKALMILRNLLTHVAVTTRDLNNALKYDNINSGLYGALSERLEIDYVVSCRKSLLDDSTIRVVNPNEMRRILENGKTA